MKKFFFVSLISLIFSFSFIPFANAASSEFVISGKFQYTDPSKNPYNAPFVLVTPSGKNFYLNLTKDLYLSWDSKDAYFYVVGDYYNFKIKSSGLGVRDNSFTVPKMPTTGMSVYVIFGLTVAISGIFVNRKRLAMVGMR